MEFRYLGRSGFKVSAISYGNWITHGSQVDDQAAIECVNTALELGITTFDTADVYAGTKAEEVLGRALANQDREHLEICTKVYWPTGSGPNNMGLSRKHITESINGSLRRLGTDYVDLYQCHRYDTDTPLEETMETFADLVRAGKVLYMGVSEWTADQISRAAAMARELNFQLISNQPQYSMLWRVIEDQVVPASEAAGVSQIVWSPLAQGVLTGKYKPGEPVPEGSRATDDKGGASFVKGFLRDETLSAVQRLQPIAAEAGVSMAQLAVAWVLRNPNVSSAIVGASRPEQLRDNITALEVAIDDDLVQRIDEALGDVVVTDPALTHKMAPKGRL